MPPGGYYTDEQIDYCLAMVIRCGTVKSAVRQLKAEGRRTPTQAQLGDWLRHDHLERYEDLRRQYTEAQEATMANDMRDAAQAAVKTARLAVERTYERLVANDLDDPSHAAQNMAKVGAMMTDKMLTMTNRPTRISETRDAEQIAAKLIAMGVLKAPEAVAELEEASVVDGDE